MERKMMALVAVALVAVMVSAVLLVWNASATSFHYERKYPAGETKYVKMVVDNLKDTNLTIAFIDDPLLMYSIDVVLYEPGMTYTIEEAELPYSFTIDLVATGRIQSITIALGTGASYQIHIPDGDNVDAVVAFGNGAMLEGRYFGYSCSGTLNFIFGENVNITKGGLDVDIGRPAREPDPLYLDIDFPDGMDGRIDFGPDPVTFTQLAGWHHEGFGIYSTASWPFENPGLHMTVDCGSCLADLHD